MGNTLDVHLLLPEDQLIALDRIAHDRGTSRTGLVREVIADYLERVQAERTEMEMAEYVKSMADISDEFVREGDSHTVERLLRETKR